MKLGLKFRIIAFATVMVIAALMLGVAANTAWQQVEALDNKLTSERIFDRFSIAEAFHAHLDELDHLLLIYQMHHQPNERDLFLQRWRTYDHWIDEKLPVLQGIEKDILNDINVAYDDYYSAATNLLSFSSVPSATGASPLAGMENVEDKSQRLIRLVYKLTVAHRASLAQLLADSQKSLARLRGVIVASLLVMLGMGVWLASMVYREMIAPLQSKLVETRALIERQEKLASLGLLAAGVAHEIRNPLTAIKARLFTQLKLLRPGSPELADGEVINQQISRLERIVRDFLQFARPSDPQRVLIAAEIPLREVHKLLAPQLEKTGIRLHVEPPPQVFVHVDPQQIQQVLINLVQNAADSIGHNGAITLRVRGGSKRLAERTTEVIILEVEDTGKGIPPDVQKRLFDPFFSTKDAGTGLGLAIAARIVEKHGGALQYQTQLNVGTTFGVVLPRVKQDENERSHSAH